jgi:DNA-binding response OmpR family regulator
MAHDGPPADDAGRGGRPHLVAVNDDADFLALLRILFQREGYEVAIARHGTDTFALIAGLLPAVVIVDLPPGEGPAWALLARLRADRRTRGVPVVVTATLPAQLARVRAEPGRYAGDALLAKPFGLADILGAVRALAPV